MKPSTFDALWSPSVGLLIANGSTPLENRLVESFSSIDWHEPIITHFVSFVDDWTTISAKSRQEAISDAQHNYWKDLGTRLSQDLLRGLSNELAIEVMDYLSTILGSNISPELLTSCLLIAPLANPQRARSLAIQASGKGYPVIAKVFDDLHELQPQLNRFSHIWSQLDYSFFIHLPFTQQNLWTQIAHQGRLRQIIEASNRPSLTNALISLSFDKIIPQTPQVNMAITGISNQIASHLFASPRRDFAAFTEIDELAEDGDLEIRQLRQNTKKYEQFHRTKQQLNAISEAIALGKDNIAHKFLRELIESQVEIEGGVERAVKSLCNLAQKCHAMFRPDFAQECLEKARAMQPTDIWTLVQLGNHFKTVGNYADALSVLEHALTLCISGSSDWELVKSSIADTYSERGEYDRAIEMYYRISERAPSISVRVAIADNLRRKADYRSALAIYKAILRESPESLRAISGRAEIAKLRGRPFVAIKLYRRLLNYHALDDMSKVVYRLSLCHCLKLADQFDDAYDVADKIVQDFPFSTQARLQRASILTLLQDGSGGLDQLPQSDSSKEWLHHYFRGVMLLKLDRFADARRELIEELDIATVNNESQTLVRLSAILLLLREGKFEQISEGIGSIGSITDPLLQNLSTVLQMHAAVGLNDSVRFNALLTQFQAIYRPHRILREAVKYLRDGDLNSASQVEAEFLLMAA